MIRRLFIFLLLATAVQAEEPMAGYLMGYSTESPNGTGDSPTLHLATSDDGLNWMPLNQNEPILVPYLGMKGLHDPFFLRKQNGGFVVLATDQADKQTVIRQDIHAWDTTDFITFSSPRLLKLHDTRMQTLAPEAFFDTEKKQYGIIWSGGTDTHRIHVNYTTDFKSVGPEEVFFDPGHDVRDATLCSEPDHGGYFLYYKDSANRLRGSHSPTLAPHSFDADIYAKPPGEMEIGAPVIVKSLHENRWFLYGDYGSLHAWQTGDIGTDTWQEVNMRDYTPPPNVRHATIIPITRAEMDRVVGRWGRPAWNRLKTWNFPSFFVRHEEAIGRISHYPFDPYQDSQWRIVPGLADANCVSFEAANFPGHYLLSVAEHVILAKDDGSETFKNRTTFVKEPGLADSSWSSFRSRSSPDLYLRHANFYLRLERVIDSLDWEDATFKIVY